MMLASVASMLRYTVRGLSFCGGGGNASVRARFHGAWLEVMRRMLASMLGSVVRGLG
jgi:hypothetical protein